MVSEGCWELLGSVDGLYEEEEVVVVVVGDSFLIVTTSSSIELEWSSQNSVSGSGADCLFLLAI